MRLVHARGNDLTYNSISFDVSLQNFKKPLDIFWPQSNTKERSEEYFVTILAVKRKIWAIFLPPVHLKNSKHQDSGLKHKSA